MPGAWGPADGFFGRETGALRVVPSQHLLLAALILRIDARDRSSPAPSP